MAAQAQILQVIGCPSTFCMDYVMWTAEVHFRL